MEESVYNPKLVERVKSREILSSYDDIKNTYGYRKDVSNVLWVMDNFFCPHRETLYKDNIGARMQIAMRILRGSFSHFRMYYAWTHNAYFSAIEIDGLTLFGAIMYGDFHAPYGTDSKAHYRIEFN